MFAIFLQLLPFFALIGLGWSAGRIGFFPPAATAYLTKFIFFFPLSAMLFDFTSGLEISHVFQARFMGAYLAGSLCIWLMAFAVAKLRGEATDMSTIEAQTAMIGNTGFLGVPMLAAVLGPAAVPAIIMVLCVDLIVFSVLFTVVISAARTGRVAMWPLALGVVKNPMVVSMAAGLIWSASGLPIPEWLSQTVTMLGAAATPGALFAIGASLAALTLNRLGPASWLSVCKLALHPCVIALSAFFVFGVDRFDAGVMVATASLPVAGNVYMLAQNYNIGAPRVSAAIFVSTAASILTLPVILHWVQ
ncbi:AEC family transporter [Thioclava litoralis]|uniref:AEC family transporter n=1 Tax=Thioclava litoralis TaxID=3076557 RepID=A0ABZ1DXQ3_9RHOB|nr:AEC family transporter [Thioclava sp. FTW29]